MLVFLDFDGVTHPWPIKPSLIFNKSCLDNLYSALSGCSFEIIISSTWREHMELVEIKKSLGKLGDKVSGITPIIDDPFLHHVRFHEIQQYLKDENLLQEKWLAIDDTQGFFPKDLNNILMTNPQTGFTQNDSKKLRHIIELL